MALNVGVNKFALLGDSFQKLQTTAGDAISCTARVIPRQQGWQSTFGLAKTEPEATGPTPLPWSVMSPIPGLPSMYWSPGAAPFCKTASGSVHR